MTLLVTLSASEESSVCKAICDKSHNLLHVLNEILICGAKNQHWNTQWRSEVIWVFANVCADQDASFTHEILKRTNLIDFLDNLINEQLEDLEELLPWLIESIFANGISHAHDEIFETCARLMGHTIYRMFEADHTDKKRDEMLTQCLKFMNRALQVVSRHGRVLTNDRESNRKMFIALYPLKQIIEHSLVADKIALNLVALETLGSLFDCEDDEAMKLLEKIEEPWTHLILNFIKPYINSMSAKPSTQHLDLTQ